ncbi:MAG TPA: UTRA domain-containing protein [Streptosporangiaceae bacterium]
MRNYAVPDHGACPGSDDIDALIMFFRHRDRIPRLEYIEEDAPRAWPALAAAGFTIERRTPVMIATPTTRLTPRAPGGIVIRQATSDTDLSAAATVQHHAYQMPHPPGTHDIARLRLAEGVPVLRVLRTVYDSENQPVEVQDSVAAADRHGLRYETDMR